MGIIKSLNHVTPQLGKDCFLAETAVIIGNVEAGNECSFWYGAVLRGDVNKIKLGNRVNVQDNVTIHCTYQKHATEIGDNVSIGHNAIVHGCRIEDDVLVGMGAIVMDGCCIKSGAIIAAGAVLTQNTVVNENELWAGVPAKKVKMVSKELKEGEIKRIAENYVKYSGWFK